MACKLTCASECDITFRQYQMHEFYMLKSEFQMLALLCFFLKKCKINTVIHLQGSWHICIIHYSLVCMYMYIHAHVKHHTQGYFIVIIDQLTWTCCDKAAWEYHRVCRCQLYLVWCICLYDYRFKINMHNFEWYSENSLSTYCMLRIINQLLYLVL